MTIKHNELIFIYNSNRHKEKEALVYAKAIEHFTVREIDVANENENITSTQIEFTQNLCKVALHDMVRDPLNEKDQDNWKEMNTRNLLDWLSQHPTRLKTPIALWQDGGKLLKDKYSLVNEGLELNKKKAKHYENA